MASRPGNVLMDTGFNAGFFVFLIMQ